MRLHRAAIADPTLHTTFERHYAERLLESRQVGAISGSDYAEPVGVRNRLVDELA
jgi:hypothetical protein